MKTMPLQCIKCGNRDKKVLGNCYCNIFKRIINIKNLSLIETCIFQSKERPEGSVTAS